MFQIIFSQWDLTIITIIFKVTSEARRKQNSNGFEERIILKVNKIYGMRVLFY